MRLFNGRSTDRGRDNSEINGHQKRAGRGEGKRGT